jgi:tetratricopeptide (TPR) repeat protein
MNAESFIAQHPPHSPTAPAWSTVLDASGADPIRNRNQSRFNRPDSRNRRRFQYGCCVWLILVCIAAFNTAWGNPVDIELEFQTNDNRLEITFHWPEGKTIVTADLTERELVFRFDRPIRVPEIQKLLQAGTNWIENLVASYDSLFVRLTTDTDYQTPDLSPGTIGLVLTRTLKPPPTRDTTSVRLLILRARLLFQQGNQAAAIDVLNNVLELEPDHLAASLFRAEILYQTGRRREAIDALTSAERSAPDNAEIAAMKARFLMPFRPFVQAGSLHKTTCD